MSTSDEAPVAREKELENRIQMLEKHLERLTAHMGEDDTPPPTRKPAQKIQLEEFDDDIPELSEEVLGWASRNAVLPRLAAVCFLMVIALILRTITDSGLVNKLLGSGLGMGYAAALMITGWYKYVKNSPLAPVFAACGAILISTIVVETHTHFEALPLVPAYLTLMATGIGMAFMSRRFGAFTPISVGILGMCLAGAAIDYPHPYFPYLSLILFTANVLGYFAAQLKRCSWLRWSVLFVTMIMLQLWGVRLGMLLQKKEPLPPDLAADWYLPVLGLFFLSFALISLLGIFNTDSRKISRFDFCLPTLNVLWAFLLARHVTEAWQMSVTFLGLIGLLGAAGLFTAAYKCARRSIEGTPGTNTFALAGATLLALSLPAVTGTFIMSLPAISLVAISLAVISRTWENGGVRATTYLMTIYACAGLAFTLRGDNTGSTDAVNMLPAGLLTLISLYHYQWCRWWPAPEKSALFETFDRNDRSAALLLLGGLASGFFMIRIGIYQAMQFVQTEMQRDAFRCGQSVTINLAAMILIILAYLRRDKEMRNVAVLVTAIGAIKVFLYDLLGTHGLPLVLSVFSFGVAAAVESIALGKWQKQSEHSNNTE